jgi:hypothetical protein
MTVVQHDWVSANRFSPEKSGPKVYASPDRRTTEQLGNADDIAPLRPQTNEAGQAEALIQRIAGTLMDEIDGIIRELERLRERLRSEGERVNREIANYADLTGAAISVMNVISANIRTENSRSTDDVVSAGSSSEAPAF